MSRLGCWSRRPRRFRSMGAVAAMTVVLVGSSWGGSARPVQAQERKQLFISVLDQAGMPVADLMPGDVKVFEDMVPVTIAKVEPVNWPMKLTVLVDNGSRSSNYLPDLRTGLRNFFQEIPEGVEVTLLGLAPQPRRVLQPTTDRDKELKSVDLLAPDASVARFFDGLAEAAARIEKDKGNYFPVIVMVTSDVGDTQVPVDRAWQQLQKRVADHAITVHFVTLNTGSQGGSNGGALQTYVGVPLAEQSGGRYENINSSTRLATLLPEIGQQIAKSNLRQTHQYRVTYEAMPGNGKEPKAVSVSVAAAKKAASVKVTLDGHLP